MKLYDVRCECGNLLGRINGHYDIKCKRCKRIIKGTTITPKENITNE